MMSIRTPYIVSIRNYKYHDTTTPRIFEGIEPSPLASQPGRPPRHQGSHPYGLVLLQYLRDILSTLTPDDVRHLLQAEDELTQAGDMERVFPDAASHKYLPYLAGPRYYNRLFDAWETRYGHNRSSGEFKTISLLFFVRNNYMWWRWGCYL